MSSLDELSIDATPQQIESAIETSLAGKLDKGMEKASSKLVARGRSGHSFRWKSRSNKVKIIKQTGGIMQDSTIITGLALAKSRIHQK